MKSKIISTLLLISLLAATASGCASGDGKISDGTEALSNTETTEAETESPYDEYGLDKNLDFGGKTFTMLINAGTTQYFNAEEYDGTKLNDAIFERNNTVENALNVVIETVEGADWGSDTIAKFQTDVQAGQASYNLLLAHTCSGGAPLLMNGSVLDMASLNNINFDKPWWNSYIIDTLNYNNRVYFCAGDLNLTTIANMWILLFNRQITTDFGKEDPYDLVDAGKWTLDAYHEQLSGISADLDSNGRISITSDRVSMGGGSGSLDVYLYAGGSNAVVIGESGPEIVLGNERSQSILEKFVSIMIDTTWKLDEGSDTVLVSAFDSGRLYFIGERMGNIAKYSDIETDYGIVPYPKYDEAQENYYSLSDAEGGMLCMPVTLTDEDAEMSAAVTQMLAGKTYESVTPEYYEAMLKTRYARDERTGEMVDLIFRSIIYDFGYVYDNWQVGFQSAMWTLGKAAQTTLQSYVDTRRQAAQLYFDNVYSHFFN